jgi:hypothetical protein
MGLKGYRLWVMGQLDSTCRAPPRWLRTWGVWARRAGSWGTRGSSSRCCWGSPRARTPPRSPPGCPSARSARRWAGAWMRRRRPPTRARTARRCARTPRRRSAAAACPRRCGGCPRRTGAATRARSRRPPRRAPAAGALLLLGWQQVWLWEGRIGGKMFCCCWEMNVRERECVSVRERRGRGSGGRKRTTRVVS